MGFLTGKKALITGVISNRSMAYGIAKAMHREGAELAFTYVGEQFEARVTKLVAEFNPQAILPCDVGDDNAISALFKSLNSTWDTLDILIHSVAFAPADQLEGDFIDNVNREGFRMAHDISSYSLCALIKAAKPMMKDTNGAIAALTYLGSERACANYNTMSLAKASLDAAIRQSAMSLGPLGIRVNGISAGPVRTLAASGIKGFRKMLNHTETVAPLRRNITIEEVGNAAAFLCSDLASGITGEILHVDAGYNTVGVPHLDIVSDD